MVDLRIELDKKGLSPTCEVALVINSSSRSKEKARFQV
jgi:hypothetical protein